MDTDLEEAILRRDLTALIFAASEATRALRHWLDGTSREDPERAARDLARAFDALGDLADQAVEVKNRPTITDPSLARC